jgi:hypothetical protein
MKRRLKWFSFVFLLYLALSACSNGKSTSEPSAPPLNATFSLPRTVVVNSDPYTSVAEAVNDAVNVDWIGDPTRASAVTLGYAARELSDHLTLLGVDADFARPSEATHSNELFLVLRGDPASEALLAGTSVDYSTMGDQGFEIGWVDQNVYVAATTPTGILYGAYRLLEHIGFAWYAPGDISVPDTDTDAIRWTRVRQRPRVELRGFWIFGEQLLPDEYTIWLARNRLNIAAGATPYLGKMLGIKDWGGGHDLLQQEFSAPGLFEQHPEWYSIINGVRRPVTATGVYFNPVCRSDDRQAGRWRSKRC